MRKPNDQQADTTACDDPSTCRWYRWAKEEINRLRQLLFEDYGCAGVKDEQDCLGCDHHDTAHCLVDGERIWEDWGGYL